MAINNLGNWTVGQLYPAWELPLVRTDANGNISRAMDLTEVSASQLSLLIYNSAKTKIGTGGGSFVINNAKPAIVTYTQNPAASGLTAAGTFYYRVEVNFNGTPDYSDYIQIVIAN